MSNSPITAANIVDSAFLCEICPTMSGAQTLMVYVHQPHSVADDTTVYDAHVVCCGPLDSKAARPGVLRDAVVMLVEFAGNSYLSVAPDLNINAVLSAGSIDSFVFSFNAAADVQAVFPYRCADGFSYSGTPGFKRPDDAVAKIPVPLDDYLLMVGRCAAAYQASLDSGFDPEAVADAIDASVQDILMEHIVRHFAEMADSACTAPVPKPASEN